jgi:hypothetical protein
MWTIHQLFKIQTIAYPHKTVYTVHENKKMAQKVIFIQEDAIFCPNIEESFNPSKKKNTFLFTASN